MAETGTEALYLETARRAGRYVSQISERGVAPSPEAVQALSHLDRELPERGEDPAKVLAELDEVGSPATVGSAGGRYFGFVIGSGLPVATAANWLASAWNQNAALAVMSPVATRLESVAVRWIRELLDLPGGAVGAFTSGDTMANVAGIAAGRHAVLKSAGWDVGKNGLFGAPPVTVVVGEEVHVSVLRALSLLGLGRERVVRVPTDGQGRMRSDSVPALHGPTILCVQAGNVNTGAFDPTAELCDLAHQSRAWVHVDGAFGLWARASPTYRPLAHGAEGADSWAIDAHKWLNVPYDSGLVFVRDGSDLKDSMSTGGASYLPTDGAFDPMVYTPEMSRRARGVDAWAALRSLGRSGIAELVDRCCRHAQRFAGRLEGAGFRVLNDVVLNQVLVSFGSAAATQRVIAAVQRDGTAWCGGTVWHGTAAMRISVSGAATTDLDVDRAVDAIIRLART
jgi:glutamate/tyrosine decarboxylase-like PLP-dependent enzyme